MNIYLSSIESYLDSCIQNSETKNPFGSRRFASNSFLGNAIWAVQDPQSRHFGNEELIQLLGPAIDAFLIELAGMGEQPVPEDLESLYTNPPMIGVSLYTAHQGALFAFVTLANHPELAKSIGASRLKAIRKSLDKHAEYWLSLESSPVHEQPWFYAQAILNLTMGFLYTGDNRFLDRTGFWFAELYRCRGTDGSLNYMRNTPWFGPVYWYSDATIYELAWARLAVEGIPEAVSLTQQLDELARELVPFYQKYLIGPGWQEYYSVIWWKQLTRTSAEPYVTATLAYMTGDPTLAWMAREETRRGLFYDNNRSGNRTLISGLMLSAIGDIASVEPADHYSFYDPNRVGVRGRYGKFNFTAQAGSHAGTVIGVTLLDENRDLRSVLQRVTPIIRMDPDPARRREDLHSLFILSWTPQTLYAQRPPTGVVRAEDYGVVATSYHPLSSHWAEDGTLEQRLAASFGWKMDQVWITTPQRAVGFVKTTSLRPNRAYGVALWNSFSEAERIIPLDEQRYAANGLILHLHDHNYPHQGTAPSRSSITLDKEKSWLGLYLTDEAGMPHYIQEKHSKPQDYHAGESWQALIEVYAEDTQFSAVSLVLDTEELIAVRLENATEELIAIFNRSVSIQHMPVADLGITGVSSFHVYRGVSGTASSPSGEVLRLQPGEALLLVR